MKVVNVKGCIVVLMICIFMLGCSLSQPTGSIPIAEGFYIGIPLRVWMCAPGACGMIPEGYVEAAAPGDVVYVYGWMLLSRLITMDKWVSGCGMRHILHWNDDKIVDPDSKR